MSDETVTMDSPIDSPIDECSIGTFNGTIQLRIAAIFIILVTSLLGTLTPIVSRRVKSLGVPERVYDFLKYFGSGVIIATGFIHLLAPAFEALGSPCLSGAWTTYTWAPALAMTSIFFIFIVELIAHRSGSAYLKRQGIKAKDQHKSINEQGHTTHGLHTSDLSNEALAKRGKSMDSEESLSDPSEHDHDEERLGEKAIAQIIGVALLEFGVVLHSFIIGLTLSVNDQFITLFIVVIFHQTFEGLGLGARLSVLPLPSRLSWVPYTAAIFYASITPLGTAIGLGIRTTYNPNSATANIVSGVLDALSAGVLIYTGLVELLAHDFIFNKTMAVEASNAKVAFSVGSVMFGAALMALLGFWI